MGEKISKTIPLYLNIAKPDELQLYNFLLDCGPAKKKVIQLALRMSGMLPESNAYVDSLVTKEKPEKKSKISEKKKVEQEEKREDEQEIIQSPVVNGPVPTVVLDHQEPVVQQPVYQEQLQNRYHMFSPEVLGEIRDKGFDLECLTNTQLQVMADEIADGTPIGVSYRTASFTA